MRTFLVLFCVNLACLASCTKTSTPGVDAAKEKSSKQQVANPLQAALYDEALAEELGPLSELGGRPSRLEARRAAIACLQGRRKNIYVAGVATTAFSPLLYLVSVNYLGIESGDVADRTLECVVRHYVSEDGKAYWHAQPLTEELASVLGDYRQSRLRREAESQNSEE